MNQSLLVSLNDQQKKAVEHRYGPLLVVAGAGSGKTRVITTRIAWLINEHAYSPDSIIALTFTNKAANEMKERVNKLVLDQSPVSSRPAIGTFHGYCLQLLRKYGTLIDLAHFSIMDSDDQTQLVGKILKKYNLDKQLSVKTVISHISAQKNSMQGQMTNNNRLLNDMFAAYEKEKELNKSLDFDDLLVKTYALFNNNKEFRAHFQERIRHILVDEYQDTNVLQDALLKLMALKVDGSLALDSLCVVGDEDQSVYSWRGATVHNILEFKNNFNNTVVIKIEQNYRSDPKILALANNVINNNKNRNPKALWSGKQSTNFVAHLSLLSSYQEGDVIAQAAKTARADGIYSIGVLYRSHHQSRIIEEALIRASISYKMVGGIQFYERKEIKDLLAYLRLLANPFDRLAAGRILNCPPRGLGAKCQEALFDMWIMHPFADFFEIARLFVQHNPLSPKRTEIFKEFVALLLSIDPAKSALYCLEVVIQKTAYLTYLQEHFDKPEAEAKSDNVKELLRAVAHFDQQGLSLQEFLHEVALIQDKSYETDNSIEPVMLMSCHAAKGLEFDFVILCGIEEGVLPSARSLYNPEDIEEERRLFYVGITRARKLLLISHVRYRYTYGSMTEQRKSRFLKEIADDLLVCYELSNAASYAIQTMLHTWIKGTLPFKNNVTTYASVAML